jgi:hypothetical protein
MLSGRTQGQSQRPGALSAPDPKSELAQVVLIIFVHSDRIRARQLATAEVTFLLLDLAQLPWIATAHALPAAGFTCGSA